MGHKPLIIILLITSLFIQGCYEQDMFEPFFKEPLKVSGDVLGRPLPGFTDKFDNFSAGSNLVMFERDMVIERSYGGNGLYSVADLRRDSLIGLFCPTGRAENEPLDGNYLDYVGAEGIDKAWFYSPFGKKSFLWNITESIKQGKTVYDRICPINYAENDLLSLPIKSFQLSDSTLIFQNPRQDACKEWLVDAPTFDIFNINTGELEKKIAPFQLASNQHFPEDKALLGSRCHIAPSRKKMVFSMFFFPVFGIIDLESGSVSCYRLKSAPKQRRDNYYAYFLDPVTDDDYVYIMYAGCPVDVLRKSFVASVYVFDWNGETKAKFILDGNYYAMHSDGTWLYFLRKGTGIDVLPISALRGALD